MSRHISLRSLAAVLSLAGIITACKPPGTDLVAPNAARGGIFDHYVAIGNSITAGYQSSGITETTQRAAYPVLLAQSMGTRMAIPALQSPGCPPPVINFQTQARPTGTTATTCAARTSASATDVLNNVAVPGATSLDPTSTSTAASNALTTFILGGKTQVQRAIDADPTFVTIWIGNNDVLGPAAQDGRTAAINAITTQPQFETNYNAMLDQLTAANPDLKGVLVKVVNVANAPIMFRASTFQSAAFKAGFDAIACGTVAAPAPTSPCNATKMTTLDASCGPAGAGFTSLINTFMAFQIRQGVAGFSSTIACVPGGASGALPAPLGDLFVLDPSEQTTLAAKVDAFNAFIETKASANFRTLDPNPILTGLKSDTTGSLIRNNPNFGSATIPFGTGMSLDGVHPAASVQLRIANELVTAINTKFGTTLPAIF